MQTSQLIIINQVNMPLSNTQVVLLALKYPNMVQG